MFIYKDEYDTKELRNALRRLEKEVAKGDRIIGELLNEGSAAIKKNKQLISLLKECKHRIPSVPINLKILDHIDAAIGESEE